MYHTFSTSQPDNSADTDKPNAGQGQRRPSAVRACEPCRRRKVKCDGALPCETCQWYRKSAQCHYNENAQRATSSKRPGDKAAHSLLLHYRSIFQKLFPDLTPVQLSELSREELIDLMTKDSPRRFLRPISPLTPSVDDTRPHIHPDADSLETFQPMPEEGSEASDRRLSKASQGAQDDVSTLLSSVKTTSSYLGISSVMAVLRIIVWLDPEAHAIFKRTPEGSIASSREVTTPSSPVEMQATTPPPKENSSSAWDEIPLINAFFAYFHPMIPLLDEQSFRDTYIKQRRSDPRWLLLLNVVLALGSAVNGAGTDPGHRLYYTRARQFLTIETFGSVHLETVQSLALLSGYYMHYLQLPNQANCLMGATLRMATALGLHRDYSESVALSKKEKAASSIEVRRRIWWCIFCLDSWASISLGRPSMGRISHAVTAKVPQQPIGKSLQALLLLQENVRFCIISTKQEDALAYSPIIDENERQQLDTAYLDWFKSSSAHDDTPKPSTSEAIGFSVMRSIMRWRYLWCRVVLHRPVLLWWAMRQIPFSKLSKDRQLTVELCRELTGELINDIALTWTGRNRCIMSAWHASWLLYQATMVPLLSLFSDCTDLQILEKSHTQVQTAIKVLSDQIDYTHTAKRSLEVIMMIYEAGKKHQRKDAHTTGNVYIDSANTDLHTSQPFNQYPHPNYIDIYTAQQIAISQNLDTPHQEKMMQNMFDSLNWSTGWIDGSEDFLDFDRLGFSSDYMNADSQVDQQFVPVPSFRPGFSSDDAAMEYMDMQPEGWTR